MANLDVKDHRDLLDALAHPRAFAEGYKVPLKSDVVLLGASFLLSQRSGLKAVGSGKSLLSWRIEAGVREIGVFEGH